MDQSGSIRAAMSVYGRPSVDPVPEPRAEASQRQRLRSPKEGWGMVGNGMSGCESAGFFGVRPEKKPGGERDDEGKHGSLGPLGVSKLTCFALKWT